jgi:hypothetical protein
MVLALLRDAFGPDELKVIVVICEQITTLYLKLTLVVGISLYLAFHR